MATTIRARDRGRRQATATYRQVGAELRDARLAAGASQRLVASVVGSHQARVSRTEAALGRPPRLDDLAVHAAALGFRLSLRLYPEGSPVRDAAQLRVTERLRAIEAPSFGWTTEALIAGFGDLRAWDVQLDASDGAGSIGVDIETRMYDIQALLRRCQAKQRDSAVGGRMPDRADTRHNRRVLRDHEVALGQAFPATPREIAAALRAGRIPRANGILLL